MWISSIILFESAYSINTLSLCTCQQRSMCRTWWLNLRQRLSCRSSGNWCSVCRDVVWIWRLFSNRCTWDWLLVMQNLTSLLHWFYSDSCLHLCSLYSATYFVLEVIINFLWLHWIGVLEMYSVCIVICVFWTYQAELKRGCWYEFRINILLLLLCSAFAPRGPMTKW